MNARAFFRTCTACRPSSGRLNKLHACTVFCLLLLSVHADARTQQKTSPTIEVCFPNYSYPNPVASLGQLNVKNSEVIIFGKKGRPDYHAHLRHGSFEEHDKIGGDSLSFEWVKYLGESSAEPNYAVTYHIWAMWAVSSSGFGVVQLLHTEDGHLKVVQQILFNLRGSEKAGAFFNAKSNALTIRGVNDWEHCCPTGLDVVQFQLKDGTLKQIHYGKAPLK
jgi:hypothetical protein